jgi:hypothetical protein
MHCQRRDQKTRHREFVCHARMVGLPLGWCLR